MSEAFIGRQPIFDDKLNVYGYELLFRQSNTDQAAVTNGDQATSQVVLNTFVEMGLDKIVGNHLAFINFTRNFILKDTPLLLPKERVVIEILEDEVVDEDFIQGVKRLAKDGYRIALDDFCFDGKWAPLISTVDLFKVDVLALGQLDMSEVKRQVHKLFTYGKKILAEKIETREDFETFKKMGFDYFQGYFLCRPTVVSQACLSTNRLATLRLVGALQKPDIDVDEVESLIREDVSLTFKLLRYINSAFFALSEEISSVRQAVVYLGAAPVKRWAMLLAMAGMSDQPQELMRLALVRGSFCELLCVKAGGENPESYFIVGLFSLLDAILGTPLPDLLKELPLSAEVVAALSNQEGSMGEALKCTLAYEQCEWSDVRFEALDMSALAEVYLDAVQWSWAMNVLLSGDEQ